MSTSATLAWGTMLCAKLLSLGVLVDWTVWLWSLGWRGREWDCIVLRGKTATAEMFEVQWLLGYMTMQVTSKIVAQTVLVPRAHGQAPLAVFHPEAEGLISQADRINIRLL